MENNYRLGMSDILYDIRWTDELDEKFISDFLFVQNEVFHCGSREEFKCQFEENIYGRSVVVVVYLDGEPVAARALWRNDIDGKEAYQPGSTCVLPICRGKGIFKEMTMQAISKLPSPAIIYNFPNYSSFPGYMKMGWNLVCDYRARLYISYKAYHQEHSMIADKDYVNWWFVGKKLKFVKRGSHYFLVQKDHRPLCWHILAEVDKESALKFPKMVAGILFYKSAKVTWYNKKLGASHVVCKNRDQEYIPTWKIDAV